ncbi:hypothetical protein CMT41_07315 [Colwellia sp. MT41]|uniref:Uncharacterized protein n=1 Tax=Colwellia marinimaniae TaxID=1513592 RepID=A0ABQ0MZU5_9GAMM|nr:MULTISPECIES: hypothetical protein [Colwellia]ALO34546.1 hypothetical protein CMT41_07315 [Colwellia sp. MT41]GAW97898.1 hypothetical protein MTCD1_03547 [Colwellia marinimaniae]
MSLLINVVFVYFAVAIAKFILLLPVTYKQARFIAQICESEQNFVLLNIQMVMSYVLVVLIWPYCLMSEKWQFFCFQPFNREAKAAIASALDIDLENINQEGSDDE